MTVKCPHCGAVVKVVLPASTYVDVVVSAECHACKQPLEVRVTVIRMGYPPRMETKEGKYGES